MQNLLNRLSIELKISFFVQLTLSPLFSFNLLSMNPLKNSMKVPKYSLEHAKFGEMLVQCVPCIRFSCKR
jgi:hypothetical protein